MSLILLAAPLSGFLVQPIFGNYADNSRSKWGRRRPYMVIGCIFGAVAMLSLGYVEAIFGQDTAVVSEAVAAFLVATLIFATGKGDHYHSRSTRTLSDRFCR